MPNPKRRRMAQVEDAPAQAATTTKPSAQERAERKQRRQARKAALAQSADNSGAAASGRRRKARAEGGKKRRRQAGTPVSAEGKAQDTLARRNAVGMPSMLKRLYRDVTVPTARMPPGAASYDASRPKVCYVHIGMHKTGTTSAQVTLSRIGARDHWRYVNAGTPNVSLASNMAFKENPLSGWQMRHEDKSSDAAHQVRDHVRSSLAHFFKQPANTYILSAESMSKFTQAEALEAVNWIKQFVDRVVVVGYLRPVRGFMESVLQQAIKGRGLKKRFDPAFLEACYPSYRERFEPWEAVLPKGDLVLRRFDRQALQGGDVVLDLAQIMGISIGAEDLAQANTSLTLDALRIYFLFLNNGVSDLPRETRARMQRLMAIALKSAGGERMRFASSLVDSVAADHLDDIAWAEARVGKGTLYIPNDPAGAGGLTSLDLDQTLPTTPAMVAWFNDMLSKLGEAPLPDQPPQERVVEAMQTLINRSRDLRRHLAKELSEDDDAD